MGFGVTSDVQRKDDDSIRRCFEFLEGRWGCRGRREAYPCRFVVRRMSVYDMIK